MHWNRWGYVAGIFCSAFLLFLIQPQLTKALLPVLGGSPVVWNATVLCFQLLLLLGYGYVWWLSRPGRRWIYWHTGFLLISLLWLPLAVRSPEINALTHPLQWVISTLLMTVGVPFLVLSTNGPLVQMAYAKSGLKGSDNPYPLYSASNLGSLLALLAYPLLLEFFWPLQWQAYFWTGGYVLFALLLGALLWHHRAETTMPVAVAAAPEASGDAPNHWRRLQWVVLAFIPSGLMLAVTTHITTDIAVAPLLWVIPLAIYLLTFILAFRNGWVLDSRKLLKIRIGILLLVTALIVHRYTPLNMLWHLLGFYAIALGCHSRLAASRPPVRWLTEFYWWIAVGGALGGVLNAIIAPMWLDAVLEYPVLLILGVGMIFLPMVRLNSMKAMVFLLLAGLLPVLFIQLALTMLTWDAVKNLIHLEIVVMGWYVLVLAVLFLCSLRQSHGSFALMVLAILLLTFPMKRSDVVYQGRNFFGVLKVKRTDSGAKMLAHGMTMHGLQAQTHPLEIPAMLTYYTEAAPAIQALVPDALRKEPIGVVGLGVGTLACLAEPGQPLDFYEIDPDMVYIAQRHFDFLSRCRGDYRLIVGDARLKLQEAAADRYGLLFLDAYTSDALPFHLVTAEAAQLYRERLQSGGVLAFNISNRHLNLRPVLAALADSLGWHGYVRRFENKGPHGTVSLWVVMVEEPLSTAQLKEGWKSLEDERKLLWTDGYSSLLRLLK